MRALLFLLLLATAGAAGAEARYHLFPVHGVFFPNDSGPLRIDSDFRNALGKEEKHYFAQRFSERFPAAETISEANYLRTFAVSLQIARASRYTVSKIDGTVDLYAPVTASIYFNNLATGEVLYANTRTTIKTVAVMPEEAGRGKRIVSLFVASFHDVVDDLISDAAKRFNPTTVSTTVRASWKELAILDAGRDQGVDRDDMLEGERDSQIRVIWSGASYAVARAEMGTFAIGGKFSKITNRTLAEIRKPRLLPLVIRSPEDFPKDALVQLFSDALGAEAAISLIPVNPTFGEVIRTVRAQIDLSKQHVSQRELPQFFVRLSVINPMSYERPTNLAYKTLRVTVALAYAEVIDQAGRVLFAAQGANRIEDEITTNMAFDPIARKEIAVKNALRELAKRFAEFKLEAAKLEVVQGGRELSVRDEHGFLPAGMSAEAFRNIGRIRGITTDVFVPTWKVNALKREGELARLDSVLPIADGAPVPDKGDALLLDGVKGVAAQRKRFGPCGVAEKLGGVELPEYGDLAVSLFAAAYPAPFYMVGTARNLMELVRRGTGFKEDLKLLEPEFDYCVQPAYRIDADEPNCSNNGCVQVAHIKFTYRVRQGGPGGDVKVRKVIETRMTTSMLPREALAAAGAEALHMDLLEQVLQLAPVVAREVAQQRL